MAALSPVYPQDSQDPSRLCLAQALSRGSLSADSCLSDVFDRSSHGGHLYSDKAPGLSILQLPSERIFGLGRAPEKWPPFYLQLWGVRVLSVGLLFVLCAFLVGRVAEGLAPGYGAASLVAFALGTMTAPLAATGFSHVATGALLFAAFVLAWSRRPGPAGIAAGAAVLTDYTAVLAAALIGAYVALRGARAAARYGAGALPGIALLALYDWAAFGAPWHPSYRYVDNFFAGRQASGLFGLAAPHLLQTFEVFAGPGGLLVVSPVLVIAALGLLLSRRDRPAEAALAVAVTVLYVLLNCSYFLPYGGLSPGPRFLVPGLPFLCLGPRTGIPAAPPNRRSRDGVLGRVDHRDRSRVALEQPHAGNGLGRACTGAGAARLVAFRPEPHRDDPSRARRRKRARRARRRRAGCGSGRRGARRPTLGEHPCGPEPQVDRG